MSGDGGPAFPAVEYDADGTPYIVHVGTSKRELFAAMAMQGLLASGKYDDRDDAIDLVAQDSSRYADALLTELAARERNNG